jgi:hypothetical protein
MARVKKKRSNVKHESEVDTTKKKLIKYYFPLPNRARVK